MFLAAIAFVGAAGAADAKKDLEGVQGAWKVTAASRDANEVSEEKRGKMSVTFEGNVMTLTHEGVESKATAEFDPAQKPAQLSFGTAEGKAPGIYELAGDSLKMAWAFPGGERPKEFKSAPQTMFLTLTREKK